MDREEVLALPDEELNGISLDLAGDMIDVMFYAQHGWDPTHDIAAAWELFESVYGRGGKIKGGAWVLGTVEGGRDVASATLMWKAQSGQKHRVHKVSVIRPRGEMAKAITQAWVCGMLGLSDVTGDASSWISDRPGGGR